jgi:hypothetical protein
MCRKISPVSWELIPVYGMEDRYYDKKYRNVHNKFLKVRFTFNTLYVFRKVQENQVRLKLNGAHQLTVCALLVY